MFATTAGYLTLASPSARLAPSSGGNVDIVGVSHMSIDVKNAPMRRANLTWDAKTLHEFLSDPQAKVSGTRMPFGGLNDPKDVDDVVAYLATLK